MKKSKSNNSTHVKKKVKKRTSIGKSKRSKPKNKQNKKNHKKYRGQGGTR